MGGPTVVLAYQYDSAGRRTQMAATIDGTADFVDDTTYDSLGRVVSVVEHGVESGNAVAAKEITLAYDDAGRLLSFDRYQDGQLVVEGDYSYDTSGRLVGLIYHQGTTVLNSYAWTYSGVSATAVPIPNPQSLIPSPWLPTGGLMPIHDTSGVTSALASGGLAGLDLLTGVTSSDDTAAYTYDATGQLTGVTYSAANPQSPIPNPSESYSYDANGNRTGSGYVVGTGNRLLSDGTYTYAYDAEGNRTARFIDADQSGRLTAGDTQLTEYTWDARNRLVEVTERATVGSAATKAVDLYYDVEDRWIGENIDSDGDGRFDHATRFAYDGTQIPLQFDKDVSGAPGSANALTVADLSHRYLWEPGVVDQLLADERTQLGANNNVATDELLWALTDQQGTVRDVARSDGTTTTVVNHVVYESYGTIVSQSDSSQGTLFGFTSRPLDTATGLQNNWHRWYTDAGWWLSQDPMSFTAGDANTSRYVGNSPTMATDPSGNQAANESGNSDDETRAQELADQHAFEFLVVRNRFNSSIWGFGGLEWGHPDWWHPVAGIRGASSINLGKREAHSWISILADRSGNDYCNTLLHPYTEGSFGIKTKDVYYNGGSIVMFYSPSVPGTYDITVDWKVVVVTKLTQQPPTFAIVTCDAVEGEDKVSLPKPVFTPNPGPTAGPGPEGTWVYSDSVRVRVKVPAGKGIRVPVLAYIPTMSRTGGQVVNLGSSSISGTLTISKISLVEKENGSHE